MDLCEKYKADDQEEIKTKILAISLNNNFWVNLIKKFFPRLKHELSIRAKAKKIYLRVRKIASKQKLFEQIIQAVHTQEDSVETVEELVAAATDRDENLSFQKVADLEDSADIEDSDVEEVFASSDLNQDDDAHELFAVANDEVNDFSFANVAEIPQARALENVFERGNLV